MQVYFFSMGKEKLNILTCFISDVFHSSPVKPVLKKSNAVDLVETEGTFSTRAYFYTPKLKNNSSRCIGDNESGVIIRQ